MAKKANKPESLTEPNKKPPDNEFRGFFIGKR